jgi:hypothetical protein
MPRRRDALETHLMPDGSALLYDPATSQAHTLNPVGSFIWEYCDGTLTPDQIAAELADALPEAPGIHAEALRMIAEFEAAGLFADASEPQEAPAEPETPRQRENA